MHIPNRLPQNPPILPQHPRPQRRNRRPKNILFLRPLHIIDFQHIPCFARKLAANKSSQVLNHTTFFVLLGQRVPARCLVARDEYRKAVLR